MASTSSSRNDVSASLVSIDTSTSVPQQVQIDADRDPVVLHHIEHSLPSSTQICSTTRDAPSRDILDSSAAHRNMGHAVVGDDAKGESAVKGPAKEAKPKEKKPANPKAHVSLLGLDNIHTLSILSWRRGQHTLVAMFDPKKDEYDDDEEHGWHLTENIVCTAYRLVGFFVLISQITFLWSLLDQYASDAHDSDLKKKPFPTQYAPAMTDKVFGTAPLNVTIATWDAARPASNVKQCKEWVLQCGAKWNSNQTCPLEQSIAFNCYPWDYEKYLQGRNGSSQICYRSNDGVATLGGAPYYGSMSKGVMLEWVLRCAPSRGARCRRTPALARDKCCERVPRRIPSACCSCARIGSLAIRCRYREHRAAHPRVHGSTSQ